MLKYCLKRIAWRLFEMFAVLLVVSAMFILLAPLDPLAALLA